MCADQIPSRIQYRIAEYDALMMKVERAAKDLHIADVTFGASIALFYAWIVKDGVSVSEMGRWILFIPTFIAIIATARVWARFSYISRLENYIISVEKEMFGDVEPNGWERAYYKSTWGFYQFLRIATWIVIALLTIAVMLFATLPR